MCCVYVCGVCVCACCVRARVCGCTLYVCMLELVNLTNNTEREQHVRDVHGVCVCVWCVCECVCVYNCVHN